MTGKKKLIISLFLIFLFLPGITSAVIISSEVTNVNGVKRELLDNRANEECDDILPRWSPDKLMVVFESIGKGRNSEQGLYYIDMQDEKDVKVSSIIKNKIEEQIDMFSLPASDNEDKFYFGQINWSNRKNNPIITFNKGVSEIRIYNFSSAKVDSEYLSEPFLGLEKKIVKDVIFLRCNGTKQLFYLEKDGRIMGTSTVAGEKNWELVEYNMNGDCSKDIISKVIFVSNLAGNDGDLYEFEMPQDGGLKDLSRIRRLTFDDGSEISPKWSPDGKSIVYASNKDSRDDIYLISDITKDKITPIRLTGTTTRECNPTFSPDGNMIAFYSTKNGNDYDLWVMNTNGKNKRKVADNVIRPDMYTSGSSWIPYGTSTLIYIYAVKDDSLQDRIEIQNVISGKTEEIMTGNKLISDIDTLYDPNNKRILIVYSALDKNTGRKRIFIKEFSVSELAVLGGN